MRSDVDSAVVSYLAVARNAWKVDLWTVQPLQGADVLWSGGDAQVRDAARSRTFTLGPGIRRGSVVSSIGLNAQQLEMTIFPGAATMPDGEPVGHALANGSLDGAMIALDRGIGEVPGTLLGVIPNWFVGQVASVIGGASAYRLIVKSPLERLDAPFPANVYQPQCSASLFDGQCRANPGSYRATAAVSGSVPAANTDFAASILLSTGYYKRGRLRFLTGANAGRSMPIKDNDSSRIYFAQPWYWPVAAGDTFELWPGCDKTLGTCGSKFSNTIHFRGHPFIPAAETVL